MADVSDTLQVARQNYLNRRYTIRETRGLYQKDTSFEFDITDRVDAGHQSGMFSH